MSKICLTNRCNNRGEMLCICGPHFLSHDASKQKLIDNSLVIKNTYIL